MKSPIPVLGESRRPVAIIGAVALVAFAVSFAVPYWLVRDENTVTRAQAPSGTPEAKPEQTRPPGPVFGIDPDDTDVTPVPGSTPDTSRAFWYIPYVNADNKRPPFRGTLNGFVVDPDWVDQRTGFDACPGEGLREPPPDELIATVVQPGPFSIDPAKLPPGLTPFLAPTVLVCKAADIWITQWSFAAKPGTAGANPGGATLFVTRTRGARTINYRAPSDRWSATSIGGRPAIISGPVVTAEKGQFGSCYLAVYDFDHDVLTEVVGASANASLCLAVAEGVLR